MLGFAVLILGGTLATVWGITFDGYGLPKYFCAAFGCSLVWLGIARRGGRIYSTCMDPVVAALGLVMAASTLASQDIWLSIFGTYRMYTWGLLPTILLVSIIYSVAWSAVSDRKIILLQVAAFSAICGYGALQGIGVLPAHVIQSVGGRNTSFLGNPVFLGSFIVLLLPVVLNYAIGTVGKSRHVFRVVFLVGLLALYFTRSRSACAAAALSLAAYAYWRYGIGLYFSRRVKIFSIIVALSSLACFAPRIFDGGKDEARTMLWSAAYDSFREHPLLGTGPSTFQQTHRSRMDESMLSVISEKTMHSDAHNDIMSMLSMFGVGSILVYGFFLLSAWLALGKCLEQENCERIALFAGLVGVWCIAKINPIAYITLIMASVSVGLIIRCTADDFSPSPPKYLSLSAMGGMALLTILLGRYMIADHYYLSGMKWRHVDILRSAQDFNESARLVPWEADYKHSQMASLFLLPSVMNAYHRATAMKACVKVGRELVSYHPKDFLAHVSLASSLAVAYSWGSGGGLDEARDEYRAAQKLAPCFSPVIEQRLLLAKMMKNHADELSAVKDLERVRRIRRA